MAQEAQAVSPLKALLGDKLLANKAGEISETSFDAAKVGDKDLVGFYFSAHWCPPCRNFTPKLKEAFNAMDGEKITIIFVSSDKDENAMKDYFKSHGDYLALPHGSEKKAGLSEKFGVQGIPMLVIVNKEGKTVDAGGRGTISNKGKDALAEWQK